MSGHQVIVLGAGATRGAETSQGKHCLPPTNKDFFTQLQKVTSEKHRSTVQALIRDVTSVLGSNFETTMEDYFTLLESMIRIASMSPASKLKWPLEELRSMRKRLMTALAAVLEDSTDVSAKTSEVCSHHVQILKHLNSRDTIISFNYDCVMDHALRREGSEKWSARCGYGFRKPSRIVGWEHWNPDLPARSSRESLKFLKLHGSLNWQLPKDADGQINLKQRLYQQRGTPKFDIIPPQSGKDFDRRSLFSDLWIDASRAIKGAEVICLVGYSFAATDQHVEALFRTSLVGKRLKHLLIVNPSAVDRARARTVFSEVLGNGCLVRQFTDLGELAKYLEDHDLRGLGARQ